MRASWRAPRVMRACELLINTRQREECSEAPSPYIYRLALSRPGIWTILDYSVSSGTSRHNNWRQCYTDN